jgi:hypothetical protein
MLGGLQSRSGRSVEEMNSQKLPGIEPRSPDHFHILTTSSSIVLIQFNICWEVSSCSSVQEIPRLLWNWKFYYRAYKSLPLGPFLSQLSLVCTFISCFSEVQVKRNHKRSMYLTWICLYVCDSVLDERKQFLILTVYGVQKQCLGLRGVKLNSKMLGFCRAGSWELQHLVWWQEWVLTRSTDM